MYHRSVPRIGGLAALSGKQVAVFGAGMEGQAFARRVGPSCSELVVLDDLAGGKPASGGPGPRALGAAQEDLHVRSPAVLGERPFDFVVHTPGVSRYDDRLLEASRLGAVVTTPTALFMEDFSDRQVVAVTGSKGKTTTAMLAAAGLRAHGLDVVIAGNIGRPVTELYDDDAHDVFVVELSSFQTAEVTTSPTVGVLTLLAPDHLDWHRGLENYYADKLRLFSHQGDLPVAVNGCCDEAVARSSELQGRVLYGSGGPVRLEGSRIIAPELGPLDLRGFRLLGDHNLVNACGAITAGIMLTGEMPERKQLEHELCTVTAPRSRLEPIGSVNGVSYIDDALASNPGGTIAAVSVFSGRQVALIVGGFDRGLDYEPLARAIEASSPRPVILFMGPAGEAIAAALDRISGKVRHEEVASLEVAVEIASNLEGIEAVIFSPAAPTPRAEGTYLERSERFRQLFAAGQAAGSEGVGTTETRVL
jgi:UDP-N-acetylmuramoylalanine--D-glutamate ligase